MKILFFITLLANIIFFLWEINSGVLNKSLPKDEVAAEPKQILLLSELPEKGTEITLKAVDNIIALNEKIVSSALDIINTAKTETQATVNNDKKLVVANTGIKEIDKIEAQDKQLVADEVLKKTGQNTVNKNITKKLKENSEIVDKQSPNKEEEKISKNKLSNKQKKDQQQNQAKQSYCHQIGPFKDAATLQIWQEKNNIIASKLKQFIKTKEKITGYLVYHPAAETLIKSRKNIEIIKQKGIKDFWLFEKGELEGVISLGLFIEEPRALILKKEIIKTGLEVKMMKRYANESSFYAQLTTNKEILNDKIVIADGQLVAECELE